MPSKAVMAAPAAKTDEELAAYSGASRLASSPDALLHKVSTYRTEYHRRANGDAPHWAMQSVDLTLDETRRATILLASALADALRNE